MAAASLEHYWSGDFLAANGFIVLNVLGALLVERRCGRSIRGRVNEMERTVRTCSFWLVVVVEAIRG